ncbi:MULTISPECIES: hypothetical protein [Pseudoalteromonas]|uniref:hypothetical protein n=1 Tax=Pseudoalteromonas TaxID=53246 RepID=UPI000FFF3065|nr:MULTISPECIES: hypothetical protein [Pseudoalteromonas]MCG9761807.1 hypothetical protein [Pseudoalteromonas sp. Isolate6]NKC20259.1 hypothetical protein [Pseudoalteromonas galatheae]RXE89639.1 hypothetical protein DRB05_00290 [Pseudoalteromonas sp. A757]
MENLPIDLRDEIDALYISAYKLLEANDVDTAQEKAEEAWRLLPEPKFDWDVTLSFVTGICKMYRELSLHEKAHNIINELLDSDHLNDYDDGPLFLKATLYFEQGEFKQAYEWFAKANSISRGRCFVEQPKKYKTFFNEYNQ